MQLTVWEIVGAVGGKLLCGAGDRVVTGIKTDSREIEPGESLTWPSKAPAIHPLEPDWTLPTRLRQHGNPLEPALALALSTMANCSRARAAAWVSWAVSLTAAV